MFPFHKFPFVTAFIVTGAALVSAHNGTVWLVNQNQTAFEPQPDIYQPDVNQVLISFSAPSDLYSQWYATLLHPPGVEERIPGLKCSFRNEGSNEFTRPADGEVVTAPGKEFFWILDPLPVTGWIIKCPDTNFVWTNVPRYGGNTIVLREADGSPAQRFNFRTKSGRLD